MPAEFQKTVVLVGFGSPSDPASPRRFLAEIFADPASSPFARWPRLSPYLAQAMAALAAAKSRRRYSSVAERPASLQMIEGLTDRLRRRLDVMGMGEVKAIHAMRYGEPSMENAFAQIAGAGITDVTVVPLFPHRAAPTTGTVEAELKRVLALPKCRGVCARIAGPLYERPEFVEAWGQSVRDALAKFPLGARVHL
ncbi:MAG: ferrochelatase, partial [Pseudomonadota bacterium]